MLTGFRISIWHDSRISPDLCFKDERTRTLRSLMESLVYGSGKDDSFSPKQMQLMMPHCSSDTSASFGSIETSGTTLSFGLMKSMVPQAVQNRSFMFPLDGPSKDGPRNTTIHHGKL